MVLEVILDLLPLDEIAEGSEVPHSLLPQLTWLQHCLIHNQVCAGRELEQPCFNPVSGVVLTRGELECVHCGDSERE